MGSAAAAAAAAARRRLPQKGIQKDVVDSASTLLSWTEERTGAELAAGGQDGSARLG